MGKRLRPITNDIPKCLVDLNGLNLLDIWISKLKSINLKYIYINVFYFQDKIMNYINTNYPNDSQIKIIKENKLYGTGGTLIKNLSKFLLDDLFLIHSDNYTEDNLKSYVNFASQNDEKTMLYLMAHYTDYPKECGILEINNNKILKGFHEKVKNPPGNLANSAIFILKKKLLNKLKNNQNKSNDIIDFSKEIIPNYIGKSKVYITNNFFEDIGSIKSYNKVLNHLKCLKK